MTGIRDIDWAEAWVEDQKRRGHADDQAFWDMRAPSFHKECGKSGYVQRFLELADVQPGQTVLDMGCGSGALALPLAQDGHQVYACDFSGEMLKIVQEQVEKHELSHLLSTKQISWADAWDDMPVADVAIASRSIATDDLRDSLLKLDSHATKRVCLTLSTGHSPHHDPELMAALGREATDIPEYVYAMNILWQMGKEPSCTYIRSLRIDLYDAPEQAYEKHTKKLHLSAEEEAGFRAYCDQHLIQVETDEGMKWRFDHDRITSWAFISWDN